MLRKKKEEHEADAEMRIRRKETERKRQFFIGQVEFNFSRLSMTSDTIFAKRPFLPRVKTSQELAANCD